MAYDGTIVNWIPGRGYGFVKSPDLDEELFVHFSSFGGGDLEVGKRITFDVADDRGGKKMATNVRGEAVLPRDPSRSDRGGDRDRRDDRDRDYRRDYRRDDRDYRRDDRDYRRDDRDRDYRRDDRDYRRDDRDRDYRRDDRRGGYDRRDSRDRYDRRR